MREYACKIRNNLIDEDCSLHTAACVKGENIEAADVVTANIEKEEESAEF